MSDRLKNADMSLEYDKESEKILKGFIDELNSSDIGNGKYPQAASIDLKYTAELQRKRLNEKNANIIYDYDLITAAKERKKKFY